MKNIMLHRLIVLRLREGPSDGILDCAAQPSASLGLVIMRKRQRTGTERSFCLNVPFHVSRLELIVPHYVVDSKRSWHSCCGTNRSMMHS